MTKRIKAKENETADSEIQQGNADIQNYFEYIKKKTLHVLNVTQKY